MVKKLSNIQGNKFVQFPTYKNVVYISLLGRSNYRVLLPALNFIISKNERLRSVIGLSFNCLNCHKNVYLSLPAFPFPFFLNLLKFIYLSMCQYHGLIARKCQCKNFKCFSLSFSPFFL